MYNLSYVAQLKKVFIDNVDPEFAATNSSLYPNYIFCTTNGEIWKNGAIYLSPREIAGVDSTYNTIYSYEFNNSYETIKTIKHKYELKYDKNTKEIYFECSKQ